MKISTFEVCDIQRIWMELWCQIREEEAVYDKSISTTKKVQGFKVFSVSLDARKDSWMQAIKDDHLTWPWHISDLKHWNSKLAAKYNIMSIPANFLLDPKGKIIGKNLKGKELDALLESVRYKTE